MGEKPTEQAKDMKRTLQGEKTIKCYKYKKTISLMRAS